MEEMTLSTKECLLAAARLGASKFFGLPDPFYGMTVDEIRRESGELQLSLEKKGYAEVGFDDTFALKPEAASLVGTCANCQSYLMVQLLAPGEKERQLLIYAGEEGLVAADVRGHEVTLRRIGEEAVAGRVLSEIRPAASGSGAKSAARVRQADLAEAQSLAIDEPSKAAELLDSWDCPAEISALLIQGFRREAGRYVFFRTDLRERTLTEMIAVQGADGAVCMRLEDMDEDLWNAEFLPSGITAETLGELCALKGAAHEVL